MPGAGVAGDVAALDLDRGQPDAGPRDQQVDLVLVGGLLDAQAHGRTITLPGRRTDRPDRDLLAWRWERFAGA